ncbi:MAG: serine/threonine protein kinase [Deltaproteobacteria bacterium]|nr:serine/threonine protein kinase [Deltaproteobacteria bacterium]
MAEIYRAKMLGAGGFEKELVVKRILPARSQDQGFIRMLVNEARLTVQLTHNNIAQIYECGAVDGTYYIAMEQVHGVSMKDMMATFARSGVQLSPEQAMFLVLQLLQGLDYAHRKTDAEGRPLQIVHCDVSPDNALVSYEGEVKLLDFGIARAATGLSNYKEGMLMGKLGYVAPEQASLEKAWDHRVDIFAAGTILYELLAKQKPFPRATDVESLIESRKAKVVPPTAFDDRLPKEIDAIVHKALAYDPEKRYPSARAFADALVDLLFPTPHSAVQDLIGQQMQQVYAERIAKQRSARAHDALVMKVLTNVAAREAAERGEAPLPSPVSLDGLLPDPATPTSRPALTPARPTLRTVRGPSAFRAVTLGTFFGLLAGGAVVGAGLWTRTGTLVVTSDPPGAEVTVDGRSQPPTPMVLEGLSLHRPHTVVLQAPDRRSVTQTVQPDLWRPAMRVDAVLPPSAGMLAIDSEPPGADVRVDGHLVGRTPISIPGVALGERHRIDLSMPGREIDQFVVLPDRDGLKFKRTLQPARPAPPARPARE